MFPQTEAGGFAAGRETSDTEGTVSGDPASGGPTSSQNPGSSGSNGTRPPDSSGSVTPPPAPADGMALDIIGDSGSPVTSTFFGSVEIEERNTYTVPSNGDLWPGAWSDDDYLYTANGDGPGFGSVNSDIAVGRLKGTPATGITRQGLAHGDAIARGLVRLGIQPQTHRHGFGGRGAVYGGAGFAPHAGRAFRRRPGSVDLQVHR